MIRQAMRANWLRTARLTAAVATAAFLCALAPGPTAAANSDAPETVTRLAALLAVSADAPTDWPAGVDPAAVRRAYADLQYRPIWLHGDARAAHALLNHLRAATRHGLRPADYRADALAAALRRLPTADPRGRARLDLRFTVAFLRYARDLRHGRPGVRPARQGAANPDVPALLAGVRAARSLDVHLSNLAPRHAGYGDLQQALRRHLAIQAAGGWPELPDGPALQQGDRGARVALLHRRLAISGDLALYDPTPEAFDAALTDAVQRFQARHGLVPDGVVAARTRAALNVTAGARADQLARNLERLRWDRAPEGVSVRVNVPAFRMALLDHGRPVLTARAVVGMPSRPTPVFADRITHLVFNPSWTVPRSIARADLLPRIRRDPRYLARAGMTVYGGWTPDAQPLHPAAVSWDRVAGRLDSYRLVQAPGPGNPLGRVKFMFPNRHNVYIHDTPDTALFGHARRAYSSGCIRIDRPMQLARALLDRTAGWDDWRIQRAVASGRTVRAPLNQPVPVRIVYRTAWVDRDGTLQLRPDIYGRDRDLAKRIPQAGADS
jgi:murein L,D-transpeptidase YcbB/YkuD